MIMEEKFIKIETDEAKFETSFYFETCTESSIKIDIKIGKLVKFWENLGFRKLKMPKGGYRFVKIRSSCIICDAYEEELTDAVKYKLLHQEKKETVWEEFLSGNYVNKRSFQGLDSIQEVQLNISTEQNAYFYFKNGALKVSADTLELIPYENYPGYILESQIIDFEIDISKRNYKDSDFNKFIKNVTANDKNRYAQLISSIGYIIHGYKSPTTTRALILVDECLDFSGEANGGTGKSIIGKAISKITSTLSKDGKTLHNKTNRFFYQDIDLSHRVLYLDDVNADFNFEEFYSVVTGDMTVEEKYKASYKIPFNLSPKLMISSNYMVKGSGGNSDERRRIEIEIAPHYSAEFTPFDEFGKKLFDDWNCHEWNSFYHCLIFYCQYFIKNGIVAYKPINLEENKLKMATDVSFVDFADMNIKFETGKKMITINKTTFYTAYKEKYPVESRNITNILFKKWLDKWAKTRSLTCNHRKSDGGVFVDFMKTE